MALHKPDTGAGFGALNVRSDARRDRGPVGTTIDKLSQVLGGIRDASLETPELLAAFHGDGPPATDTDKVAVGDLNSDARGSGARKNSGKAQWHQLPLWTIEGAVRSWRTIRDNAPETQRPELYVWLALRQMSRWQTGDDDHLDHAIAALLGFFWLEPRDAAGDHLVRPEQLPLHGLEGVVRVLEFGEKKYKKANWAKGMPWSVCYDCTINHLRKYLEGSPRDHESGLHTLHHALCNMLFLVAYRDLYPEGDDRISEFFVDKPSGKVGA